MIFSLVIVLLLVWILQTIWRKREMFLLSRKLRNKYSALPIIGHGFMFLGTGEDRMKTLQNLGREANKSMYGLTSTWIGYHFYPMTCDPIIAGIVTKSSLDKSELKEIARHLLGNGSIFAPVDIWRIRRKILAPTFLPKNIDSFVEIFAEQSLIMMKNLESKACKGTFSVWKNVSSYAMDSICQTALGVEINAQAWHLFSKAFEEYCNLIARRVFQPWLQWVPLNKLLPDYQTAEKHRKTIHEHLDNIIRKTKFLSEIDNDVDTSLKKNKIKSFLDLLINSSNKVGGYSELVIREEILVLMLAGSDTSAVGTSFTIVMLSRYLNVQERAYKEVHEIFGDSKRPITLEDLAKLQYLDAVIRESLRLYPPVPLICRQNDEDVKISSDITLPAGSGCCINIFGINRNPRYWGDDAEEFNPDRFLDGSVNPGSAFMSFSYGPRNCLGYKYAMLSMKVVITTLLRYYRVLPPSDLSPEDLRKPLRLQYNIMMKDVDDFKVQLEHRN